MPDIKLRDGSGVEQTYTGVDWITVPLADGTGTYTYGPLINFDVTSWNRIFADTSVLYREELFKDNYIIKLMNKDNLNDLYGAFADNKYITDLSNISVSTNGREGMINILSGCYNLKRGFDFAPILKAYFENSTNANSFGDWFQECYSMDQDYIQNALDTFYSYSQTMTAFPQSFLLEHNYQLKKLDLSKNLALTKNNNNYSRTWCIGREPTLQELTIYKAATENELTTNEYWSMESMYMLSSFRIPLGEDGQPYKAKMKGQTLDFSSDYVGYYYQIDSNIYTYGYPNKEHNVYYGVKSHTTLSDEEVKSRYDAVKQYDDWHSISDYNTKTTYDEQNVDSALLTSRYNHDSAVETINSLPDTSEYLAANGGTNTIKFKKYSGALTDGGGINTLTEEEIAVATAKGWTVTLS